MHFLLNSAASSASTNTLTDARLSILNSGNVGIGVADPDCALEVGGTSAMSVPSGTTAQRDGSPAAGYFRWNTTTTAAEIYDGSDWALVGGGNTTGKALWEHSYTVAENYEMTSGNNALTAGPITIN